MRGLALYPPTPPCLCASRPPLVSKEGALLSEVRGEMRQRFPPRPRIPGLGQPSIHRHPPGPADFR